MPEGLSQQVREGAGVGSLEQAPAEEVGGKGEGMEGTQTVQCQLSQARPVGHQHHTCFAHIISLNPPNNSVRKGVAVPTLQPSRAR